MTRLSVLIMHVYYTLYICYNIVSSFIVIDRKIIWQGCNFFDEISLSSQIERIDSEDVAEELLERNS